MSELLKSAQAVGGGTEQKRNSADLAAAGESVVRELPESAQAVGGGTEQKRNSADLAAAGESVVRELPKRRLRFEVAYDGTDFHGWQVQPGLPTIQGELEQAIGAIERKRVQVAGSGRTDAGVHALAQVAAVSLLNPIPADNFRRAVNRLLPRSIRISSVCETNPTFHPRFDARRKTYQYRIFRDEVCSPFLRQFVYHHPYPLDEAAISSAAPMLEGEHDFTAFAAHDDRDEPAHSKRRTIFRSVCEREENLLVYTVTGSGFLKHMVRNMVGLLLETGKGNLTQSDLIARLEPGCGIPPGPAAPASGLFLVSVDYD